MPNLCEKLILQRKSDDLQQSGCKLDSRKRQALLKMTLNGFGVKQDGKALQVHASVENFASRKHNLVQAMLAVNNMFYLREFTPILTTDPNEEESDRQSTKGQHNG